MFEFKKLCNECERLGAVERGLMLAEKSVSVAEGLKNSPLPFDPIATLVTFIVGSVVSDGAVDEKDYLYIYPSLVQAFGADYDFASAKQVYKLAKDVKKEIKRYAKELIAIIGAADERVKADVIMLCLLVTSVDGKVSLKEKRYIRQLCKS